MRRLIALMAVSAPIFVLACGSSGGGGDGDGDVDVCTAPSQVCNGTCVDVTSNHDNCGGCGNVCGAEQVCQAGQCTCTGTGLQPCGGACVNTATDPANCGTCGNNCGVGGSCIGGSCQTCAAQETVCDNRDDDCDGSIDEGLTEDCSNLCGTGVRTCTAGAWGDCSAPEPEVEECDGEDNDCDGTVDDGCDCEDGTVQACGPCEDGMQGCTDGEWGECEGATPAVTETCDGEDNDCDGSIDEDLPMGAFWAEEPNDNCERWSVVSFPFQEGGSYTMTGYSYHNDLTADTDVVRIQLQELSDTLFCFTCCGDCGFLDPSIDDVCFECMTLDVTLTSPEDLDLEVCLNVTRAGAGSCDEPIERVCTNDGDATDDTVSFSWEGWCNRDDNLEVFVEIFPRIGTSARSSCLQYEVGFHFSGALPSDERCGAGFLSWGE